MGDLVAAIKKQIQYAENELKSGDTDKALEHLDKAAGFVNRLATEDSTQPATVPDAGDAPLSDDTTEAAQQLLVRYGFAEGSSPSGAEIVAASPDQGRDAALVGLLGQPGAVPSADYSLFQQYYEATSPPDEENGMQSWAPKAEWAASGSAWKHRNHNR